MKIEIDLNDILGDEYGSETLQESVRRQVIDKLTATISEGIRKKIDAETSRIMNETLQSALQEKMPALLDDIMSAEYTPVSRYGDRGEKTSFRQELIKAVAAECTYQRKSSSYDENTFTQGVRKVIESQMEAFKKEFAAKIDDQFKRDALTFAVTKLSERLGILKA